MSALETLGPFVEAVADDPTEEGLAAAIVAHPGARAALVDYLAARIVRLEPNEGAFEDSEGWWTVLVLLAERWEAADKARFRGEVALAAATPDGNRWLAPFVRAAFPAAEVEPWILEALEEGGDDERVNASHLAYFLFDGEPDYELSPEGRARLAAADGWPGGH